MAAARNINYGTRGNRLYTSWESRYKKIQRSRNTIDPDVLEEEMRRLKLRIAADMGRERDQLRYIFASAIAGALLLCAGMLMIGRIQGIILAVAGILLAIIALILFFRSRRVQSAFYDFDSRYFSGEIAFKIRKRMPI